MSTRIAGGRHRGRKLRSSTAAGLRPTTERVRSAIFSLIGRESVEGVRALDLYAGTGALGIEALSRGATWASFVEINAGRCRDIRHSLEEIGIAGQARVYRGPAERVLGSLDDGFGLVLIDPPYDLEPWAMIMDSLDTGQVLEVGGLVVAEHSRRRQPADSYGRIGLVTRRRYGDTSVSIYRSGEASG